MKETAFTYRIKCIKKMSNENRKEKENHTIEKNEYKKFETWQNKHLNKEKGRQMWKEIIKIAMKNSRSKKRRI